MAYYDNGIVETVRMFLNAFGFVLRNDYGEERKIYIKRDKRPNQNEKDEPVGKFHINRMYDNNNTFSNSGYLYAKLGAGILTAQILSNRFDERCYNRRNTVKFQFLKEGKSIDGTMILKLSSELYYSCSVNMTCLSEKEGKETTITLNNGDELFKANIKGSTSEEEVCMTFFGPDEQGVWHTNNSLGYDKTGKNYPCSEKVEITGFEKSSSLIKINKEKRTREGGKTIKNTSSDKKPKPDIRGLNKKEALTKRMICASKHLYSSDSTIGDCIRDIFDKVFVVGNAKVAKNFAIVCYSYYDDRAIDSLLGITGDMSFYQRKSEIIFGAKSFGSKRY